MTLTAVLAEVAIVAVPVLAAIIFHEVAHGGVAYLLGDPTAARQGRLTLNPLPHIDPVGTLLLPGMLLLLPMLFGGSSPFLFGYARPVPIDPRRFRSLRRDTVLVALAGPLTNLALAAASAGALAVLPRGHGVASLTQALRLVAVASVQINCLLAVFNLLPIPPLDGGRVLGALLPSRYAPWLARVEGFGFVIVLALWFNTDVGRRLVRGLVGVFLGWAR
ncbi:MAG: site-2 protease family protein [Candidatus Binatia bacterium]